MNTVEGWFAVGAIVGPAIVAALLSMGLDWRWLYAVAAAICLGLVVMTSRASEAPRRSRVERASVAQMGVVLRDPLALGFSLLIALYVAVEVAIYVWMPTYLQGYDGPQAWLQTWALTLFFVLRAAGRFLGAWVLDRVAWTRALLAMGAGICLCFVGALVGGLQVGVWLLPAAGLFMSIVYPTLNSKAISSFPHHQHGAAAGVILCFTALAAAIRSAVHGRGQRSMGDAARGLRAGDAVLGGAAGGICWSTRSAIRRGFGCSRQTERGSPDEKRGSAHLLRRSSRRHAARPARAAGRAFRRSLRRRSRAAVLPADRWRGRGLRSHRPHEGGRAPGRLA